MHPPCVPKRNQRRQRGVASALSFLFTLGVLLVVFGSSNWRTTVAPGPLSSPHAQLFQSQSDPEKCTACHQEFGFQSGEWLTAFWATNQPVDHPQARKCMECHTRDFSVEWAAEPHSLSLEEMAARTKEVMTRAGAVTENSTLTLASFLSPVTAKPTCGQCHQEHKGTGHDLTAMTGQQCQSCHAQQFESFSHGHPEFDNWPLARPAAIKFNHVTHAGKHFVDSKKNFDCNSCHHNPQTNEIVSVVSFEHSCAECHQEQLNQSVADGLPLLTLPTIDRTALAPHLSNEFNWPNAALGDFDGQVPALMQFLISKGEAAPLPEPFQHDLDFALVDPENPTDLDLIAGFLPRMQELWFELAAEGQPALIARIEAITGRILSAKQKQDLSSLLPLDLFRLSYEEWFGTEPKGPRVTEAGLQRIRLIAGEDGAQPRMYITDEMIVLPGDELLLESLPPGEWVGDAISEPVPDEIEEPEKPDPQKTVPVTPPPLIVEAPKEEVSEPEPAVVPEKPKAEIPTTEVEWQAIPQRGWYRDDLTLTIGYRPVGHADPFLTSWLELAFAEANKESSPAVTVLRNQLRKSAAFKNCLSCHDLDRPGFGSETVNWRTHSKQFQPKSFTKFSHAPHLTIPELQDCTACHTLESASTGTVTTEFSKLSIQTCASCHRPKGAKENCLECHFYHIDHRSVLSPSGHEKRHEEVIPFPATK
ncbi:MAG: hypothetical protein CMJ46_12620 [Planctomyces sp.]|nr:hypothetical protein [Planctomyces sp.]